MHLHRYLGILLLRNKLPDHNDNASLEEALQQLNCPLLTTWCCWQINTDDAFDFLLQPESIMLDQPVAIVREDVLHKSYYPFQAETVCTGDRSPEGPPGAGSQRRREEKPQHRHLLQSRRIASDAKFENSNGWNACEGYSRVGFCGGMDEAKDEAGSPSSHFLGGITAVYMALQMCKRVLIAGFGATLKVCSADVQASLIEGLARTLQARLGHFYE